VSARIIDEISDRVPKKDIFYAETQIRIPNQIFLPGIFLQTKAVPDSSLCFGHWVIGALNLFGIWCLGFRI
jgi:hypothetical protein